jgi:NAD(P)H-dependent FMN reductase
MYYPKILVMPGSLRTGSHNARLAALAAKDAASRPIRRSRVGFLRLVRRPAAAAAAFVR